MNWSPLRGAIPQFSPTPSATAGLNVPDWGFRCGGTSCSDRNHRRLKEELQPVPSPRRLSMKLRLRVPETGIESVAVTVTVSGGHT